MNLASPEYYLAEVLSAGETWTVNHDGHSQSDAIQLPPAPSGTSLPEVRISGNVFLIGTVNVDETTRTLSPKVLDRSAVYDLHHVDLFATPPPASSTPDTVPKLNAVMSLLTDRPRSLTHLGASESDIDTVGQLLSNLAEVATALGGPIAYRQRDGLLTMLTVGTRHGVTDVLSADTILDVGLRSCVLPKWQGSTPAGYAALRRAAAILLDVDVTDDAPTETLQSQASVSRFPRTCEKILAMIEQYKSFGYFSAW